MNKAIIYLMSADIANGEWTFAEVPKFLKKHVKKQLIKMGLAHLAQDEVPKNTEE